MSHSTKTTPSSTQLLDAPIDLDRGNALTTEGKLCRNKKNATGSCHVVSHQATSPSGLLKIGNAMAEYINVSIRQGGVVTFESAEAYARDTPVESKVSARFDSKTLFSHSTKRCRLVGFFV